ncbi:unnamed protein product [Dibothriocephalus latus]|uniref:glycogenin glucosyltransferase n=1 Tax=Dibothriocephalus latus TaxID=60516 RepID=A0A3P7M4E5_DIBLA|nr:unnamed protein product [Dibothriocephalus latus]
MNHHVLEAFVTLATTDEYACGALVLAHSLKRVGTTKQLVCMVTRSVNEALKSILAEVFDHVELVDVLDSKDELNLALLSRPDLGVTFTKLHCWRLTQYSKAVFLDADTLVIQNIDDLFEREEFSAAPDPGWPDCFNTGVFVFTPNLEQYRKLLQFALEHGSFDGGDQVSPCYALCHYTSFSGHTNTRLCR